MFIPLRFTAIPITRAQAEYDQQVEDVRVDIVQSFGHILDTQITLESIASRFLPHDDPLVAPYSSPNTSFVDPGRSYLDGPLSPLSSGQITPRPLTPLRSHLDGPLSPLSTDSVTPFAHSPPHTPPRSVLIMAHQQMPMPTSRDAPQFSSDPEGFDLFFECVAELGVRANLVNGALIKWAIRYAGSEAGAWRTFPTSSNPNSTLDEFRADVRSCYPHLRVDRRYTIADLDRLVERTQQSVDMSRDDFGDYFRRFRVIATWLVDNNKLSEQDRSHKYLRGFPQPVRASILRRLEVTQSNVFPSDGYPFTALSEAATFVAESGSLDFFGKETAPSASSSSANGSVDELVKAVSALTALTQVFASTLQPQVAAQPPRMLYQPAPGGAVQQPPRRAPANNNGAPLSCLFCSSLEHFIRECPVANQYLAQAKIIRIPDGRLALPDGTFPSRNIQGANLKEKFDRYWESNGNQTTAATRGTVSTNYLQINDEAIFQLAITPEDRGRSSSSPIPKSSSASAETEEDAHEQVQIMQAQIDSLRDAQVMTIQKAQKMKFDGVEVPPKPDYVAKNTESQPTIFARGRPPHMREEKTEPSADPKELSGKSGVRAGERPVQRPQGPIRPVEMRPKPPAEEKFRYQSAVEQMVNAGDLSERALDAPVTLSTRELIATSPEVRKHFKEVMASKKVATNYIETAQDSYISTFLNETSPAPRIDLRKYSPHAEHSLPLRVIYPTFAPGVTPECILDGGAQIIVMRKDIWRKLGTPITASKRRTMESANAGSTETLGVVEDHLVQIGPVKIYLQIQVIEDAPFEVLLGRPFFEVTNCTEVSRRNGEHEIYLRDPQSGEDYRFQSFPRSEGKSPTREGVNFQD